MKRREFEQLVSEWLDRPEQAGLRTRVLAAVRGNRRLARLLKEWWRLHKLIRDSVGEPADIACADLKARIAARLERGANPALTNRRFFAPRRGATGVGTR